MAARLTRHDVDDPHTLWSNRIPSFSGCTLVASQSCRAGIFSPARPSTPRLNNNYPDPTLYQDTKPTFSPQDGSASPLSQEGQFEDTSRYLQSPRSQDDSHEFDKTTFMTSFNPPMPMDFLDSRMLASPTHGNDAAAAAASKAHSGHEHAHSHAAKSYVNPMSHSTQGNSSDSRGHPPRAGTSNQQGSMDATGNHGGDAPGYPTQSHREILSYMQSMTAQQFHQAATAANQKHPTNFGNGGPYATSSARINDDDLLALMNNVAQASSEDAGSDKSREFRQMVQDLARHHLDAEDSAAATSDGRPIASVHNPVKFESSYFHMNNGGMYTDGGLPASAPAAFQDGRHNSLYSHPSDRVGQGTTFGPYQNHQQYNKSPLFQANALGMDNSSAHQPFSFISRDLSRSGGPGGGGDGAQMVDPASVSSYGDASVFSSIMGGKWGMSDNHQQTGSQPGRFSFGPGHQSRGSFDLMGTPATVFSSMSHSGSGRSPDDNSTEEEKDGDVFMKTRDDDMLDESRGRNTQYNGHDKIPETTLERKPSINSNSKIKARRNSTTVAAAGGSTTRGPPVSADGNAGKIGKAPRASSKSRAAPKRTPSFNATSGTRIPATLASQNLASSGSSGAGSRIDSETLSPTLYDNFPLPTSHQHIPHGSMTVDRGTIDLPSLLETQQHRPWAGTSPTDPHRQSAAQLMSLAHQRRMSTARAPPGNTSDAPSGDGRGAVPRRHSMNDGISGTRLNLSGLGIKGQNVDEMATVDECAVEGRDEPSAA